MRPGVRLLIMQNSTHDRVIAVTGATGFVGRYVCRELLRAGYRVRALVRSRRRATEVLGTPGGLSLVVGDVLNERSVDDLLGGAWACVNLVGILRERRVAGRVEMFERIHVGAVRLLISRCEALGVKRLVHVSALGVRETGVAEYQRSKFKGEMLVRRSSLDWTVLRPGLIHGRESEVMKLAAGWSTGLKPPFLFMPYFTAGVEDTSVPLGPVEPRDPRVAPVAVEDVAGAVVAALAKPASIGEVYNLVGAEELTWPEMLRHVRDHVTNANPRLSPWGIPSEPAAALACAAGLAGMDGLLPFDAGMARMGAEDLVAERSKAGTDLGFRPSGFRGAFEAYASSL